MAEMFGYPLQLTKKQIFLYILMKSIVILFAVSGTLEKTALVFACVFCSNDKKKKEITGFCVRFRKPNEIQKSSYILHTIVHTLPSLEFMVSYILLHIRFFAMTIIN